MALSINVADFIKMFLHRGHEDRERLAAFVDQAATSAKELADVWEDAARRVLAVSLLPTKEQIEQCSHQIHLAINRAVAPKVRGFYENVSSVFGGGTEKEAEQREVAVWSLSRLLAARENANHAYITLLEQVRYRCFFDSDTSPADFTALATAVAALHKEAAALHVLAASIRASKP
jgi:hypothetical protein